jgi:hypothetical protein
LQEDRPKLLKLSPVRPVEVIHQSLAVVMGFAYSRPALEVMRQEAFVGEWKGLDEILFDIQERQASKALVDLAIYLRFLDNEAGLSKMWAETGGAPFGTLTKPNGETSGLTLRDVANKLIHASIQEWSLADPRLPGIVCTANAGQDWVSAEIDLLAVVALCSKIPK